MEAMVVAGDVLLGKYRVERVLGRGGMGLVVAARHIDLGQLFAIKLLLPAALDSENGVERFLREARESARLASEHVVRVVDVGRLESGAPYMVMEHLSGQDLRAMIRSRGPLPVEEAVTYLRQACEAIAEAHALGLVHRDLKPANLFLHRRAKGAPCLKLLDFGISRPVAPDAVELTKTGMMVGSPLYMSPEQMAKTKKVDTRSDIWSMGIVLYELVTGVVPFNGGNITEVVASVIQDDFEPPTSVRAGLPAWIDAIVARCLEKRPERRYQTITEFAEALQEPFEATLSTRLSEYGLPPSEHPSNRPALHRREPKVFDPSKTPVNPISVPVPGPVSVSPPHSSAPAGTLEAATIDPGSAPTPGKRLVLAASAALAIFGCVLWLLLRSGGSTPAAVAAGSAPAPVAPPALIEPAPLAPSAAPTAKPNADAGTASVSDKPSGANEPAPSVQRLISPPAKPTPSALAPPKPSASAAPAPSASSM